jgi:hypothetical protein
MSSALLVLAILVWWLKYYSPTQPAAGDTAILTPEPDDVECIRSTVVSIQTDPEVRVDLVRPKRRRRGE